MMNFLYPFLSIVGLLSSRVGERAGEGGGLGWLQQLCRDGERDSERYGDLLRRVNLGMMYFSVGAQQA